MMVRAGSGVPDPLRAWIDSRSDSGDEDILARFIGRIAHGMLFSNWLTRLLGTEYPGKGTVFLRNSNVFFAPVYPGIHYRVRISSPLIDRQLGAYRIVAQVHGEEGKLAAISYNDMMRRSNSP